MSINRETSATTLNGQKLTTEHLNAIQEIFPKIADADEHSSWESFIHFGGSSSDCEFNTEDVFQALSEKFPEEEFWVWESDDFGSRRAFFRNGNIRRQEKRFLWVDVE